MLYLVYQLPSCYSKNHYCIVFHYLKVRVAFYLHYDDFIIIINFTIWALNAYTIDTACIRCLPKAKEALKTQLLSCISVQFYISFSQTSDAKNVCTYIQSSGSSYIFQQQPLVRMISTVFRYFINVTLYNIYRACVTVVEHFKRFMQCLLDLYGVVKPVECSSVDWQESEVLNGFKINCN